MVKINFIIPAIEVIKFPTITIIKLNRATHQNGLILIFWINIDIRV